MDKTFSKAEIPDRLLQGYGINPDLDDDTASTKVLEVLNDVGFYTPTVAYAEGMASKGVKTFIYRFNEGNPWDGPWKGRANHILDVAFLFQNFNAYLEKPQRQLAEAWAEDVFKFCYGQSPWDEWKGDQRVAKVLGPEGRAEVVVDGPGENGRSKVLWELAEMDAGGMDHLSKVLNDFLRGPPVT
ncbi:Uu.00g032880.m01.CDS01 [Anthostomella pinea]|uniref:Uu.00g032880.m01.CDS01 n=1 Tax=Anthostomella pinea TaxID=933095 RepID=A0AAI8V8S5_9PEZI|nr:Uu.00g032880.m01.CDS01 [Anthostomella pinea]